MLERALHPVNSYASRIDFTCPEHQGNEDGELGKKVTGGGAAPEGLCFIQAMTSPDGRAMLAAAFEVSGTIALCSLE